MTQQGLLHNLKCGQSMIVRAALRAGAPLDMALALATAENPEQSRALHVVPMFHITGCGGFLASFNDGKKMHIMRRWSAKEAVALLVRYNINQIAGVPAISSAILQHPDLPADHQLNAAMYGGAAPPERLGADMKKRWPDLVLNHAWGMTECQGLITSFIGPDYLERPKSCGPPIPSNDVRVVDVQTRRVLGPNEVGCLEVRGFNVCSGYLDDPVATAKAIDKDGWLDTGDAGYIDEDGFVYVSDRIKDIIIRGGENIASEEVENAVYRDDRVAEAASVPVPDDRMGELVAVAVSLKPGVQATPESIIETVGPR
jgi:acyl-CoA synthetase (AMP-forming)/AMP-acid ligase II